MQQWKRRILNTGVSLSVLGGGALLAEGTADAHDATDASTPAQHHALQGVVATLGVNSFTVTTHKGATKTIDTTSTTSFAEIGTTVAPTGVSVGQDVVVALDPCDATPTAVHVTVILDRVSGNVLNVNSTSITLGGPKGTTRDAVISSSTLYFSGKTAATGVTVGEFVTAFGTKDTRRPLTSTRSSSTSTRHRSTRAAARSSPRSCLRRSERSTAAAAGLCCRRVAEVFGPKVELLPYVVTASPVSG